MSKIIDCITFFDNNLMFDLRYNILKKYVDYFVICESLYDHKGKQKKINFNWNKKYSKNKIKYFHNSYKFRPRDYGSCTLLTILSTLGKV